MIRLISSALVVAVGATCLAAPTEALGESGGTLTVQFENDRIANTDRHYTHGTRFAWVSDRLRDDIPWAADALNWLYPFAADTDARVGIALGQSIFTPDDIVTSELVADDRPYAGWLYVGFSLHTEGKQSLIGVPFTFLDTLEVDLGVVGPESQAKEVQTLVHNIIDVQRPNGWDNQLDTEPGLLITLERTWRPNAVGFGPVEMDLIPHAAVSLGNIVTEVNGGALLRVGQGLSVDFGPPHIRPNLTGVAAFDTGERDFAWYMFAGAAGRVVGRNIFLDGNTFSSSHSVDKRRFVGDFPVGIAMVYKSVRVSFSHVFRTREFDGQPEADRFGAVSLSVNF